MQCLESLKIIKDNHEKNGKKYPRPKVTCHKCKEDMILCWGKKHDIYLKHESTSNECTNNNFGISEEHNMAQDLLITYLNNGGYVNFTKNCNCCQNVKMPNKTLNYVKEYRYKYEDELCIFDIMGLNQEKNPNFGIEICYTHVSENIKIRNNINWTEIRALEVIEKLYKIKFEQNIILKDMLCNNIFGKENSINKSDIQINDIIDININNIEINNDNNYNNNENIYMDDDENEDITDYFRKCNKCAEYNIDINEPLYKNKCKKCYNESLSDKFKNYNMIDIALGLYYLTKYENYPCDARRIVDLAIHGFYENYEYVWNVEGYSFGDSEEFPKPLPGLWTEFLRRKKCIKCENYENIRYGKPFCNACFKVIKNHDVSIKSKQISISASEKFALRTKLNFLYKMPKWSGIGSPCNYCGDEYEKMNIENEKYYDPNSNYVNGKVWWIAVGNVSCCTICLEKQMKKLAIL